MPRPRRALDLIGQQGGRLTVVNTWLDEQSRRWIACNCVCGTVNHICRYNNFQSGQSRSCGCLAREAGKQCGDKRRTHGDSCTPMYRHWLCLRARGGLSGGWEKYEVFRDFAKNRPAGTYVIRKDANAPYSPENFSHWGTKIESSRQRSNGRLITLRGQTKSMTEWAAVAGVTRQAFQQWLSTPEPRSEFEIEEYVFEHESFRSRMFDRAAIKRRHTVDRRREDQDPARG